MKSPDIACIQMATSLWLFSWFAEVKLILCGQQYISTNRPGSIAGIACRAEVDRAVGLLKRERECVLVGPRVWCYNGVTLALSDYCRFICLFPFKCQVCVLLLPLS